MLRMLSPMLELGYAIWAGYCNLSGKDILLDIRQTTDSKSSHFAEVDMLIALNKAA